MNEIPLSTLLQNRIFPYERTKKHIRCKVQQPISQKTHQCLEYWKRIQSIPIEIELVDATTFQKFVETSHSSTSTDEKPFFEQKLLQILETAYQQGCSDVHFEPYHHEIQIFLRNQGKRSQIAKWPIEWQQPLVHFIKIKAELDIQYTKLPMNGQFSYRLSKETIFCRISLLPSLHGDCIVLRLHSPQTNQQRSMDWLLQTRFAQSVMAVKPGLWLIAGPVGNGKTTTYYHLLNGIKSQQRVFSFEDPIEIQQPQLFQLKASRTLFAESTLRILLRQNVNLVGFGEVRSAEQLKFVVNAALTGHCAVTTFHANSLEAVLQRLTNFGYTDEQQAFFLNGILFQHWDKTTSPRTIAYQERIFLREIA